MIKHYFENSKILKFVLYFGFCCFFLLIFAMLTFADDSGWDTTYDDNDLTEITYLVDSACVETVSTLLPNFDVHNYNWLIHRQRNNSYVNVSFIPKDYILYRTGNLDSYGNPKYAIASYDEETKTLVRQRDLYNAVVRLGRTQTRDGNLDVVTIDSNDYVVSSYNGKYAYNEEYALKYFQTMDSSYLENGEKFVNIPNPKNVSFYLTKSENGGYLYYENDEFSLDGFSLKTRLAIVYSYIDASGERVDITMDEVDLDWFTRNQYFIDFAPLENYDTGIVAINVVNYASNERAMYFCDSPKSIEYSLGSDYYSWFEYGGDLPKKFPIVDYGSKNPSYTGGVGGGSISPGLDSDYGFLDGVFNAFGLIGENGLIQFMGDLFSFIPTPIIVALSGFVFAAIIIALFKMFVK